MEVSVVTLYLKDKLGFGSFVHVHDFLLEGLDGRSHGFFSPLGDDSVGKILPKTETLFRILSLSLSLPPPPLSHIYLHLYISLSLSPSLFCPLTSLISVILLTAILYVMEPSLMPLVSSLHILSTAPSNI